MNDSLLIGLIGLTGTIVGAVLGFWGGLILERRRQKADTQRTKAVKLEELMSTLEEHKRDFDKIMTYGAEISFPRLSKLMIKASVYYPEFIDDIGNVNDRATMYSFAIKHNLVRHPQERANLKSEYDKAIQTLENNIKKRLPDLPHHQ